MGCGTFDEASRARYQADTARSVERLIAAGPLALPEGVTNAESLRAWSRAGDDPSERARRLAHRAATLERAQAVDPLGGEDGLELDAAGNAETWADALRLQSEGIEPAQFSAIRAPVRMFHGARDPHPGPSTRDTLRAAIRQLSYREFPDCGHTPWLERGAREVFLSELGEWLARHSVRSDRGG